jgi:hypothetical protein
LDYIEKSGRDMGIVECTAGSEPGGFIGEFIQWRADIVEKWDVNGNAGKEAVKTTPACEAK